MAEVRIPVKRFTSLSFPSICAVSGLPAAELFAFTFDGIRGGLPLTASNARLMRQQQWTLRALAFGVLVLLALTAALHSPLLGIGAAATTAIVLANYSSTKGRLPRGTIEGKELHLRNVHPAFIDALDNAGGLHKCANCPAAGECSTEKVEACDGNPTVVH